MSELIHSYKSQMKSKCLTCPVFLSTLEAAETDEFAAQGITDVMIDLSEIQNLRNSELGETLTNTVSDLMDMSTDDELKSVRRLARLAENADSCPAPKRGGVKNEVFSSKVVSWLRNNKICQNPGLDSLE